jgi:prespore-specific regulator
MIINHFLKNFLGDDKMVQGRTDRKDGWSASDDSVLAKVVLEHIRAGSTQLEAFNDASERLGRTSAACGFRWNSTVRKTHEKATKEAKLNGNQSKGKTSVKPARVSNDVSFEQVIRFMMNIQIILEQKENEIAHLKEKSQNNSGNMMTEDYKTLLEIMDRARKLTESKTKGKGA